MERLKMRVDTYASLIPDKSCFPETIDHCTCSLMYN